MNVRTLKIAMAIAVALPSIGIAQHPMAGHTMEAHRENSWEFSLLGGALRLDPSLRDFLGSGAPESRFANEATPGLFVPTAEARIGYNFGRHFGASVGVGGAMGAGVRYLNPTGSLTGTVDLNARTSPFAMIGTEFTRIDGENDRVTHSTWGAHAGLGIRHMVSSNNALRLEGRMQYARYDEVPMSKHDTYSPSVRLGFSHFSGGRAPHLPMVASMPAPVRVDTVRSVRVDTVTVRPTAVMTAGEQVVLRVQFQTARAELLPESHAVLNTVASSIKATPDSRWEVEGHTDSIGSALDNRNLSQARAQSVMDYLISQGVDRSILSATGYGQERPVFSNTSAEGRAENRRVQLRRLPPPPATLVP